MAIKNIKGLLTQATTFPAAIEAKLPAGAPKVSTMLLDVANQLPAVPDFPMEIPDLPAVPTLPGLPGAPTELARNYITGVEVRPVEASAPAGSPVTPLVQAYTQPIEGVVGQVVTRRGM